MQAPRETGRKLCAMLVSVALVAALFPCTPSIAYADETANAGSIAETTGDTETKTIEGTGNASQTADEAAGSDGKAETDNTPDSSAEDGGGGSGTTSEDGSDESEDESASEGEDEEEQGEGDEDALAAPSATALSEAVQTANGIKLQWAKGHGNTGYAIYRLDIDPASDSSQSASAAAKESLNTAADLKAAGYTRAKKTTSADRRQWTDADVTDNCVYVYRLYTYVLDADGALVLSETAATATVYKVATPASAKLKRSASKESATISWSAGSQATGYQVQWSATSLFTTKKSATQTATSLTASGLDKKKKTYYARVRTYVCYEGVTYYSPWTRSDAGTTKAMTAKRVKQKNGKKLELRAKAKLKLYKYDTVQGSCSDGTYAYFAMNNRTKNKCRIVKMCISNRKIVKVSKILNIGHGNDMTWNSDTGCLVVPYTTGSNQLRVASIDPKTLRIAQKTSVHVGTVLDGATASQIANIKKVYAISYNSSRKHYVVDLDGSHNLLILDSSFNALTYVTPSKKASQTYQTVFTTDDYIIATSSAKSNGQKNVMMVYDWEGNFIKKLTAPTSYELEGAYLVGNTLYVPYYHSYQGTYYTTKKVTVKSKGKKKTVTKRIKHTGTIRNNYLYKITVA